MTEQPPSAPTTEAGRHFLDVVLPRYGGLRQSAGKWTRSEFTDAILAIEAEARQQDTPALRSDAIALMQDNTDRDTGDVSLHRDDAAIVYRALAALPPSAPPALDVERLAQALEAKIGNKADAWVKWLEGVAAEYARLGEER